MRYSRACLVALLLALSFALGCASAHAASLDEALAHFTADDFSETSAGIGAVALSGDPRAETIIRALQDGRLMFSAESKAVYVKDESGKLTNAATGEADRRRRAGRSRQCAHQQSAARRDRCGARRPDAACRRSRHAIRGGAGRVQVAGGERVADARDRARQGAGSAGQAGAGRGQGRGHSVRRQGQRRRKDLPPWTSSASAATRTHSRSFPAFPPTPHRPS